MDLSQKQAHCLEELLKYAEKLNWIWPEDLIFSYNMLLDLLAATGPSASEEFFEIQKSGIFEFDVDSFNLDEALAELAEASVATGRDEDTASGRDRAAMRIMGYLLPKPSDIAANFWELYEETGAQQALDYFYGLAVDSGYVRKSQIAKNICWESESPYGDLEITINLSKPEKDPREIAKLLTSTSAAYPACQLCIQNEGYPGRAAAEGAHPARQNLRIIPLVLNGYEYGLQYSPYAYFDEHCIVMSVEHRPMHIDEEAFASLLDFVDLFDHYFIGSNADLPIVGGSILNHDHFQGGRHTFPLMKAAVLGSFQMAAFPEVEVQILKWPLSVMALKSENAEELLQAATKVLSDWRSYSDEGADIIAHDGEAHNTITPILKKDEGVYTLYLALRNNRASDEHPLGIFHPHAEYHHIKKENIGLIEVMGLAILPPRLASLIRHLGALMLEAKDSGKACSLLEEMLGSDEAYAAHLSWAKELYNTHEAEISPVTIESIIKDGIAEVFCHVLEDAGVFKQTEEGLAHFKRFYSRYC